MDFHLSTTVRDGRVTVEVAGELDIATTPLLRARLREAVARGPGEVVLDLRGLTFADAAGLGALVAARLHAEAGGSSLVLAEVPPSLTRLLRITGLDAHLTPQAQVTAPLRALRRPCETPSLGELTPP
ncbi:STAS domain-containing protein [Nonomuraea sp. SBT364]|uniref:STAS domain-containing protein n=1 Tax=Nonomuraea sp. SBT364 TaxID=1580530 RepID=UPI0007C71441|nr:STAS domain-containing protein [Nonomuraea sp. SBT364]